MKKLFQTIGTLKDHRPTFCPLSSKTDHTRGGSGTIQGRAEVGKKSLCKGELKITLVCLYPRFYFPWFQLSAVDQHLKILNEIFQK